MHADDASIFESDQHLVYNLVYNGIKKGPASQCKPLKLHGYFGRNLTFDLRAIFKLRQLKKGFGKIPNPLGLLVAGRGFEPLTFGL